MKVSIKEIIISVIDVTYLNYLNMNMRVTTTQTITIDTVQSVPIISLLESGNVTLVNQQEL
jgi:hypothetical protein